MTPGSAAWEPGHSTARVPYLGIYSNRVMPCVQEALRRRDSEISRLGTRAGTDPEVISIVARNEANESMILQLNQTVGRSGRAMHVRYGVQALVESGSRPSMGGSCS